MNPQKTTLQDVATAAGVSTATVSRCLNEPEKVKPSVQKKVNQVIKKLAYVPHGAARALASRRTRTIGAIIPTIDNAIFSKLIRYLQQTLSDNNFTLLIAQSNYSSELELKEVQEMLSRGVDGLVMVGEARQEEIYQLIEQYKIPSINLWTYRADSKYSCAGINNVTAGQQLAEHMIELGHEKIGYVWGIQQNNDRAEQRLTGIGNHLENAGVEFSDEHIEESRYSVEQGKLAFYRLVERMPDLTAVICGNDILALGVMTAARELGLKVPQSLSVSGFDNLGILSMIQPALTTMNAPSAEMGSYAANYLVTQIKAGTRKVQREQLPCPLIIRETTAMSVMRSKQEKDDLFKQLTLLTGKTSN
ncbi:MAG: LacI family transcriptional regulator [Arenicella sp.]|jgi:LacI family transcriptional regulator